MAARNAETTIKASIDSVFAQNYGGLVSLIVVNDASTDSTRDVVSEYPEITLLNNEKQLGRSLSRNVALPHVRTDLVAIQDADDISRPNRLADTVPLLHDDRCIAGGQVHWIDPVKGEFRGGVWPTGKFETSVLLQQGRMPLAHPTMVMPIELMRTVGGYDDKYPVGEDLDLLLRIRISFPDVSFVNSPFLVCEYRRPQIDDFGYLVRSTFWRQQILERHQSLPAGVHRLSWLNGACRGYLRQRVKLTLDALRRRDIR